MADEQDSVSARETRPVSPIHGFLKRSAHSKTSCCAYLSVSHLRCIIPLEYETMFIEENEEKKWSSQDCPLHALRQTLFETDIWYPAEMVSILLFYTVVWMYRCCLINRWFAHMGANIVLVHFCRVQESLRGVPRARDGNSDIFSFRFFTKKKLMRWFVLFWYSKRLLLRAAVTVLSRCPASLGSRFRRRTLVREGKKRTGGA